MDVCITVGEFLGTEPTSSSSDSNRSLEKGLQHTKPRLSASQQKSKSAKRNLSQKFEDASAAGKSICGLLFFLYVNSLVSLMGF